MRRRRFISLAPRPFCFPPHLLHPAPPPRVFPGKHWFSRLGLIITSAPLLQEAVQSICQVTVVPKQQSIRWLMFNFSINFRIAFELCNPNFLAHLHFTQHLIRAEVKTRDAAVADSLLTGRRSTVATLKQLYLTVLGNGEMVA